MATELGLLSLGHPTSLWHLVKCFSDRPNDGMELLRLRGSVGLAPRRELEPVQKLPGSFSSHSSELSAQQLHGDAGAQRRSWWDGMGGLLRGRVGRLCAVFQLGSLGCLEGKLSHEEPAVPVSWLQAMS